jgi:glutamate-5-semialdehyde dehydrogenase
MDLKQLVTDIALKGRQASRRLAFIPTDKKNKALLIIADKLNDNRDKLKSANSLDIEAGEAAGLSSAMLDRLKLTDKRIDSMIDSLRRVAGLDDPVGEIFDMNTRPNGLRIGRMRVPIGVIGIIYESRPNVTCDAGSLCLKSGNAVILRGGKEAINSNKGIIDIMTEGIRDAGLPDNSIQLIPVTDREAVTLLLTMNQHVDLIIPRGGRGLIETVVKNSTIPVIKHYDGNCFIYVDDEADLDLARKIVVNAKTQRTGVCNALESLLICDAVAEPLLSKLIPELQEKGVEIRADERVRNLFSGLKPATDEDWYTEYLDLILSIGVVSGLDKGIEFINHYGSHHTDAIITKNYSKALRFLNEVDSACVFVNCSTRFSDGGEFGMGCEIGISTDELHARGPMGLKELTTAKFIVFGDGQIRE